MVVWRMRCVEWIRNGSMMVWNGMKRLGAERGLGTGVRITVYLDAGAVAVKV
jgi:hypothetical protein